MINDQHFQGIKSQKGIFCWFCTKHVCIVLLTEAQMTEGEGDSFIKK